MSHEIPPGRTAAQIGGSPAKKPSFGRLTLWRNRIRWTLVELRRLYLVHVWGMDIGEGCTISFSAKLDKSYPRGVHIGRDTAVTFGCSILTHDFSRRLYAETRIGERCQIGPHSIIMPGVTIGDGCVIAAGSVVMKDIPPGCLAFGNPARVMETGLVTGKLGVILDRQSKRAAEAEPAAAPARAQQTSEQGA